MYADYIALSTQLFNSDGTTQACYELESLAHLALERDMK